MKKGTIPQNPYPDDSVEHKYWAMGFFSKISSCPFDEANLEASTLWQEGYEAREEMLGEFEEDDEDQDLPLGKITDRVYENSTSSIMQDPDKKLPLHLVRKGFTNRGDVE